MLQPVGTGIITGVFCRHHVGLFLFLFLFLLLLVLQSSQLVFVFVPLQHFDRALNYSLGMTWSDGAYCWWDVVSATEINRD